MWERCARTSALSSTTRTDAPLRGAGDFEACADPLRLRQVLYNLLSNAVQYNVPGGTVTVEAAREGDGAFKLSVNDTGLGIAPEHYTEIFQEFRQLRTQSRGKGTGLGLAVTKRLVERMSGSISLESEVGRGSRFTVRLPVKPQMNAEVT